MDVHLNNWNKYASLCNFRRVYLQPNYCFALLQLKLKNTRVNLKKRLFSADFFIYFCIYFYLAF